MRFKGTVFPITVTDGSEGLSRSSESLLSFNVRIFIEGAAGALLATVDKMQDGRLLADFDADDLKDICIETLKGVGKGAVRGSIVYVTTNFTSIPAPMATAGISAAFGIASEGVKYAKNEITAEEVLSESLWCLSDSVVSAGASMLGSRILPSVLSCKSKGASVAGALIGNALGMLLYRPIKKLIMQKL